MILNTGTPMRVLAAILGVTGAASAAICQETADSVAAVSLPGSVPARTITAREFADGVRLVYDSMLSRSPDPFEVFPAEHFEGEVRRLSGLERPVGEAEAFVEIGKFIGLMRDGHSWVSLDAESELFSRALPLRFWKFSDGLHIRATSPALVELLGAEVMAIGGVPIDEAWDRVHEAVGGGGRIATARAHVYLEIPEFLAVLGLAEGAEAVRLRLRLADGREIERTVEAEQYETYDAVWQASHGWQTPDGWIEPARADSAPWFGRRGESFWYAFRPGSGTLHVAINVATYDSDNPWNPEKDDFRPFLDEVFEAASRERPKRLVIDLRNNNGGFTTLWQPLVHHLIRSEAVEPGKLFVITGRLTESAAVSFAARIESNTPAVFVGEPTASPPNFYNDFDGSRRAKYDVPGTALNFRVANSEEQWSLPWDDRRAIYPDVPVTHSFEDFAAGRDPVLRAIQALTTDEATSYRVDEMGVPLDDTYGENAFWANSGRRSQLEAAKTDAP